MKNMKVFKKVLLISMALLMAVALAGCGKDGADAPAADLNGKILVSAAASLQEPLDKAYELYKTATPNVTVEFNYGGSGALVEQIANGAPADAFISANTKFMDKALEKGLIDEASRFDWLINKLAVVVPADGGADLKTLADVAGVKQLALGAIESVPAGQYAKTALEKAGVWADVEGKVVYGKDVKQVATYVESGSADAGFVYVTDTVGRDGLKTAFVLSPEEVDPIIYPAAVINASVSKDIATDFLNFLQTPEVIKIFEEYGFELAK